MSSITDAEVVTVFDAASLFAFFRWASWAFTRLDCLIDLEGFEDSLLKAGLFMQLHFLPTMSRRRIGLKDSRAYDCSESQAPDEKGSPRHASSSHQNRTIGGDCCSLLRLRLRPVLFFKRKRRVDVHGQWPSVLQGQNNVVSIPLFARPQGIRVQRNINNLGRYSPFI